MELLSIHQMSGGDAETDAGTNFNQSVVSAEEPTGQGSLDYSRTETLNFRGVSRQSEILVEPQTRYVLTGQSFLNDTTLLNQNPIQLYSQDEISVTKQDAQRLESLQTPTQFRALI